MKIKKNIPTRPVLPGMVFSKAVGLAAKFSGRGGVGGRRARCDCLRNTIILARIATQRENQNWRGTARRDEVGASTGLSDLRPLRERAWRGTEEKEIDR